MFFFVSGLQTKTWPHVKSIHELTYGGSSNSPNTSREEADPEQPSALHLDPVPEGSHWLTDWKIGSRRRKISAPSLPTIQFYWGCKIIRGLVIVSKVRRNNNAEELFTKTQKEQIKLTLKTKTGFSFGVKCCLFYLLFSHLFAKPRS